MYPFVETIKFFNKIHCNLEFHQERFDLTRMKNYPGIKTIKLNDVLSVPENLLTDQLYKCRVIYGETVREVIYEPYFPRKIHQYYLVVCPPQFDYTFKTNNRSFFENALKKLKPEEDYIYVKNGLITDTSYANIVFSDGTNYVTSASPLLKGTKRAYCLKQGLIKEDDIKVRDIKHFKSFFTINAMLDFGESQAYSCDKLLLSHIQLKL